MLRPLLRAPTICKKLTCQVLAVGLWGSPCKKTGLSHARHSQFQPPPADPLETLSLCQEEQNAAWQSREKCKESEKISPADTKLRAERRAGGAPARIPLQPVVLQVVPLHFMEVHNGTEITYSPWRTSHWSGWMPKAGCVPVGSPRWSSWQDLQTRKKTSPHCSKFAGRTGDPMKDPRWKN